MKTKIIAEIIRRYWGQIACSLVIFLLCVAVSYYRTSSHSYRDKAGEAERVAAAALSERDSMRNTLAYTLATVTLMNDIGEVTRSDKQDISEKGKNTIVVIKEAVKDDTCAILAVPAAADNGLRNQLSELRARSADKAKQ
ncbi:Rz-like protein [Erwinia phage Gungnir39]|nr:Rz-like protein [Erwinia phage Gungnir39]